MDCSRMPTLFTARLDRELERVEEAEFDRHLEECSRCRSQWQGFHLTLGRLGQLEPLPAPPELLPGIMRMISAGHSPKNSFFSLSWFNNWKPYFRGFDLSVSLPTAAATVALAMVLALLVKGTPFSPTGVATLNSGSLPGGEGVAVTERVRLSPPETTLTVASSRNSPASSGINLETFPTHPPVHGTFFSSHPDLLVLFKDSGAEALQKFISQCRDHHRWRLHPSPRGVMWLDIPAADFDHLRRLLSGHPVAIAPAGALSPGFADDRISLRVAIRTQ